MKNFFMISCLAVVVVSNAFATDPNDSVRIKGGVTSGGGNHNAIRECVERYTQIGLIDSPEQIHCTSLNSYQRECVVQVLNLGYSTDEVVRTCALL